MGLNKQLCFDGIDFSFKEVVAKKLTTFNLDEILIDSIRKFEKDHKLEINLSEVVNSFLWSFYNKLKIQDNTKMEEKKLKMKGKTRTQQDAQSVHG